MTAAAAAEHADGSRGQTDDEREDLTGAAEPSTSRNSPQNVATRSGPSEHESPAAEAPTTGDTSVTNSDPQNAASTSIGESSAPVMLLKYIHPSLLVSLLAQGHDNEGDTVQLACQENAVRFQLFSFVIVSSLVHV